MKTKKTNDQPIGDILQQMVRQNQWKTRLDRVKIKEVWLRVMGETVARYTRHVTLRGKTLVLLIDSAPLKQELSYAKAKIIRLVNEECGEELVKEVLIH